MQKLKNEGRDHAPPFCNDIKTRPSPVQFLILWIFLSLKYLTNVDISMIL
jgi:hypothetical protein